MTLLLALGLGVLIGWVLSRGPRKPSAPAAAEASARPVLPGLGRLQLLAWLEGAPQGWLVLDGDQRIQAINPRAERLLQLPADRLVRGQPLRAVIQQAELEEAILSVGRRGRPQRLEWWQGNEPLEGVLLAGGEGWVALWINSRRSLESQLDQQSRWVSDVAHELKTPLTALLLVGERLAAEVGTGPSGSGGVLVERLQRELKRLQELVGDLLELSSLENSLPLDERRYEVLDLWEMAEEAWSSLRPLAESRGVRLVARQRQACLLWADASRLHRALLNLFENALRYSPDGGVVELDVASSGLWWELEVRDHGPGLSQDDLVHLFERFYRGDPSRVRSQQAGSGLGLAIVQQIALTHGGRVQARNHPDGGAVIELVLPKGV
ncbi:cell wall metabolism sensor histidine kinase WalK [Synechococcus sp. CS-205]|jgi:two-component system phosphate regulon sensor histidine kinase PhoR|uniref:sensor histidine kinase n=1 Tax=Synechococcus sp. CS-205 TaxID=2847984 RepID=UPI00223A6ED0|nr:HAMP domain-containing sensor histidine kinase [Synechococcus sp. CS-205]MCT0249235.1 HAMP domain-containing histidine kinase [Synechococcus sp. CS-205]